MRVKKERFALKMNNDIEVRSLDELRENFDLSRFFDYAGNGTLLKWLECWRYSDEAAAMNALDKNDPAYKDKLCAIFGIDTEEMKWRRERIEKLQKFTNDESILSQVDNVAFDTEELYDLLDEGATEIYLCNNEFRFPSGVLNERNKHYHGIGEVKIIVESNKVVNFDLFDVTFDGNIKFNEEFLKTKLDSQQPMSQQAETLRTALMNAIINQAKNKVANKTVVTESPKDSKPSDPNEDERHRRFMIGKKSLKTLRTDNGIIIIRAGETITEEILEKAKLANKFIDLQMNVQ